MAGPKEEVCVFVWFFPFFLSAPISSAAGCWSLYYVELVERWGVGVPTADKGWRKGWRNSALFKGYLSGINSRLLCVVSKRRVLSIMSSFSKPRAHHQIIPLHSIQDRLCPIFISHFLTSTFSPLSQFQVLSTPSTPISSTFPFFFGEAHLPLIRGYREGITSPAGATAFCRW